MKNKRTLLLLIVGALMGSFYFFLPYNNLEIFGVNVYLLFGACSFIASFLLMLFQSASPKKTSLLLALGAELSIITSIFLDISKDSSRHNLFPLEVFLTFVVFFSTAFVGSFFASLINQVKVKHSL